MTTDLGTFTKTHRDNALRWARASVLINNLVHPIASPIHGDLDTCARAAPRQLAILFFTARGTTPCSEVQGHIEVYAV